MLERSRATVMRAMESLDRCIGKVDEMLMEDGSEYDTKLASHLAYLTKHAIMNLTEVRQLEKHERDAIKRMKPDEADELVAAYIRELPRDRRAQVRAVLDECDGEQLLA